MTEETLGDVLERYERSKALYKLLDAELKVLEAAVDELTKRESELSDKLEATRPKSKSEVLENERHEELAPLREVKDLALKLVEEEYFKESEKIEAEYQIKADRIEERFEQLFEQLDDEDDDEGINPDDWYEQNSPEYASLSEELRLLKVQRDEIHKKRLETRHVLNASVEEKKRRLSN